MRNKCGIMLSMVKMNKELLKRIPVIAVIQFYGIKLKSFAKYILQYKIYLGI